MTKETDTKSQKISRRGFMTNASATAAGVGLIPGATSAAPEADALRNRLERVIADLETVQGWETSASCAAKAFAAYQIRKAIGFDLPDPGLAMRHIQAQRRAFDDMQGVEWFQRDQEAGANYRILPFEKTLA